MTAPRLVKWENLSEEVKRDVRRRYVHWDLGGMYKTQEEWGKDHAFYVTGSGRLDNRYKHCEPAFLAG